jgi:flotillin
VFESGKKIEMGKANTALKVEKATFDANVAIANIEARAKAALRDAEMQTNIEKQRANVLIEKERAENLAKALVTVETIQKKADAELYKAKKTADAILYNRQKEAEAIRAKFEAKAAGVEMLQQSFNGDNNSTLQYIMLQKGIFKDLAQANAEAIKKMRPEITVWTTGAEGSMILLI